MEQRAEQLQGKLDKLEEKRVGATQQMQRLLNLLPELKFHHAPRLQLYQTRSEPYKIPARSVRKN